MRKSDNGFLLRTMMRISMIILLTTAGIPLLIGQEGNSEAPVEEAEEAEEMLKSRMALTVTQYPDATLELGGLLRVKAEGSYQKVSGSPVAFFNVTPEGEEIALGEEITGANGVALLKFPASKVVPDAEGYYSFIGRFDGNDLMTGSESDLRIYPATLDIQPVETDTGNQVALVATAKAGDTLIPLADATVSVYITRMFSRLKVGEGTTDETGAVQIDIPKDLPGDEHSNLEIIALIEETDEYGTLSAAMTKPWGQPISHEIKKAPRALWSPNPPTWMIVTFFILMGTVWGHYLVIVFQLFRIKAAGKKESIMN